MLSAKVYKHIITHAKRAGMAPSAYAEYLGVSRFTLSKWKRDPRKKVRVRLLKKVGLL